MITSKFIGDSGEHEVCKILKQKGFEVLNRNWRTKYCEIDIVAKKANTIYFVEVKTRKSDKFGSGFDYITKNKLKQMSFAAELWVSENNWQSDYQLAAASVTNNEVEIIFDV